MGAHRTALHEALELLERGMAQPALLQFEQILGSARREEVEVRVAAMRGKAAALRALGKPEAALACLEQAQWVAPGNPEILGDIAVIVHAFDLAGMMDDALRAALSTIEGVATALQVRGRHEPALMLCDKIIERNPADRELLARAWATKGRSLRQMGLASAALEWLDRALEVNPDDRKLAQERAAAVAAIERVGRG
jgi:tetratricopeptide (TPR) repeat protein